MIAPSDIDEAAFWDESICLDCGEVGPSGPECPECGGELWFRASRLQDILSRIDQGELE